ncbi:MAG: multidrug efflux SMR transporter [Rhodoferax sp.]|uniref:DMT family transporter n=1 Tax=Rhodoferax sp. TaxID=50421 RepID=UPI00260E9BA3|nr:multidrug efflux SMR transporter [Rhodoferax sp.]MDD2882255.1 multidrug efflux SMR transporter [Rhodoferax sp.]
MVVGPQTGWWLLLGAGVCEVVWAAAIARTDGFTRLWPSLYCAGFIVLSLYLLSLAMRTVPMGTAYAVWVGIGAVSTVLYGILFLNEAANTPRLLCLLLIVAGVVGLKVFGSEPVN